MSKINPTIHEGDSMANDEFRDTERLEWLMHYLSGHELRRIGVDPSSGGLFWARVAIDKAMAQNPLT